jgi:hypothetical protein
MLPRSGRRPLRDDDMYAGKVARRRRPDRDARETPLGPSSTPQNLACRLRRDVPCGPGLYQPRLVKPPVGPPKPLLAGHFRQSCDVPLWPDPEVPTALPNVSCWG